MASIKSRSFLSNFNIRRGDLEALFLKGAPLIDVRAPVEFNLGSLPSAINLPILNDEERALVGTTYKQKGRDEALRQGHELVSGLVKAERLKLWSDYIEKNPDAVIYCFRGGLRSQLTQQWLKDIGYERPLIVGGYKLVRNYLIEKMNQITQASDFLLVSGPTGSGKTQFLKKTISEKMSIDLEELAMHRGSAFGARSVVQPSQTDFENSLAVQLIQKDFEKTGSFLLFEDESRLIGKNIIPSIVFNKMRESQVIWIEESLQKRIQNIFEDYVLNSDVDKSILFANFKKSVLSIEKKLGGLRSQEIISLIEDSQTAFLLNKDLEINKKWIEKILVYYYDPLYLGSIQRRQVKIAFKGSFLDCQNFISSKK